MLHGYFLLSFAARLIQSFYLFQIERGEAAAVLQV